ncbi:MAG: outer membrane lipid asymmetry maintenance protein MlaD [Pseudomonadota bacterium]|jgi:phospholipid/cholesterol/gamma-HCH transport system substrate-binding protein|nr:outer membrane lipid asymmetry maintenance protein MlaD [Rhodospirillaceae bacterium]MEC7971484.1 outer membrane lipid asymmetry maintenance protein MlaD [Pseudomonadota bacterium]
MRRGSLETVIGALVVFVAIIFVVFASKITDYGRETGYLLFAEFNNIGSIKMGSDVRVGGIPVGKVIGLSLNPETFKARVSLDIDSKYNFPTDTAATIGSEGLLGGSFVELIPGGMEGYLGPNNEIEFTQDAVDMLQLLGKFMYSGADSNNKDRAN